MLDGPHVGAHVTPHRRRRGTLMDMVVPPALIALDRPQRSYELVYERLRRAILDGTFPPGARLVEADLAEQLAVSRTPVREALRRLESDGFAQRIRGGLVITPSGPDDLGDIGLLRIEIDSLAARLAATRGTKAAWADLERRIDVAAPGPRSGVARRRTPRRAPGDLRHRVQPAHVDVLREPPPGVRRRLRVARSRARPTTTPRRRTASTCSSSRRTPPAIPSVPPRLPGSMPRVASRWPPSGPRRTGCRARS